MGFFAVAAFFGTVFATTTFFTTTAFFVAVGFLVVGLVMVLDFASLFDHSGVVFIISSRSMTPHNLVTLPWHYYTVSVQYNEET
jgi:hypothetical protein